VIEEFFKAFFLRQFIKAQRRLWRLYLAVWQRPDAKRNKERTKPQ